MAMTAVAYVPTEPPDCWCSGGCSEAHLRQRIEPGGASGRSADLAAAVALGRDTWADVAGIGAVAR
jgi:hypothetical protein